MKISYELTLQLCSTVLAQKIHPLRTIKKKNWIRHNAILSTWCQATTPPPWLHTRCWLVFQNSFLIKKNTKLHYISGTHMFKFNAQRERLALCNSYCIYKLIGLVYHASARAITAVYIRRRLLGSSTYKILINKNEKKLHFYPTSHKHLQSAFKGILTYFWCRYFTTCFSHNKNKTWHLESIKVGKHEIL